MGDTGATPSTGQLSYFDRPAFEAVRRANAAPVDRVRCFAAMARFNTLYMIARAGSGHIGSCFSSLDIVSWLHLERMDRTRDVYFSSKGHDVPALYSVLAGLGELPFEDIHRLRRLGGPPGHPDVGTPGIAANTGSLGMGISKAKGMLLARRRKGEGGRIYVMTGDGELQEGQIWESLGSAANGELHEITVIVDHNKIQSDTYVERVGALGDLEAKFAAFGWAVARADGHDLGALEAGLATLQSDTRRPGVLIADTIKGYGVSFMAHTAMAPEDEFYRFHSGAPSAEDYARASAELSETVHSAHEAIGLAPAATVTMAREPASPAPDMARLLPAYGDALVEAATANDRVMALDADLILDTGLIPFRDRFPDRFIECGIAEQDMVSMASGLAREGMLPVVHSFGCFLSSRANDQIHNAATEGGKIVYMGALTGLIPAGPGHSHQSLRDISAVGGMPNMTVIEPSHPDAVAPLVEFALRGETGQVYLRLVSVPVDLPYSAPYATAPGVGQGAVLREAADPAVVVVGYGPILLAEAHRAIETLAAADGPAARLVDLPYLNRVDGAWLRNVVGDAEAVVTLDNHYVAGGQGSVIGAALAEQGWGGLLVRRGVEDIPECGETAEVLAAHGLDAAALAEAIANAATTA
jgi:transketolase